MDPISSYGKLSEAGHDGLRARLKARRRITIIALSSIVLVAIIIATVVGVSKTKNNKSPADSPSVSSTIKAICGPTLYPDSCYNSLAPLVNSGKLRPQDLYKLSVQVAVNELSRASKNLVPTLAKSFNITDQRTLLAIESCQELFDLALDHLNNSISINEMNLLQAFDDLRTWLSSAATYQQTCIDEFADESTGLVPSFLEENFKNSTEYTSNSLAIVSSFEESITALGAIKRRRLMSFVSFKDRRLMRAPVVKADVVVAKDGSGKYMTIGEALNDVPNKSKKRFVIYVKKGVYVENVRIEMSKWNVMMIGDGKNVTIVEGSLNNVDGTPTFQSATFAVFGQGFIARDMGFRNTAGPTKNQAVALLSTADFSVFYRCTFDAFQDTLYTHSNRQFYRECDIYGTVDFIFGNSASIFQNCNILPVRPMSGQQNTITAQGKFDPNQNTGLSIQNCTIFLEENFKNSTEYTSNSLAIVSSFEESITALGAIKRRRLMSFVSFKDRRLMRAPVVKADVVVAKDGSGKYMTIGEALNDVPNKSKKRFVIYVKKGVYVENVRIEMSKWNVMMIGDGKNVTIVEGSLNNVDGTPTFQSATFAVFGQGFIARDMGFRNTAGPTKNQAVALLSTADFSVFYRCTFDAFQDTLYTHSNRQFYRECDIYGTVDFIFGNSASIFQNCNILPVRPMSGQQNTITAQGKFDPNQNTGLSIQNCTIFLEENFKNSTEYTSNSLAIVSSFEESITALGAIKRRRLMSFVSFKDRRLMRAPVVKADVVVAKDGSGKYMTIGEALNDVPNKSKKRFVIYVKKGVYVENVRIEMSKWNVMMIGDGKNVTIVEGSLNNVDGTPTFQSATFAVFGQGFIARDMGFRNTAGPTKNQAVALLSTADFSVFYRCTFDAFQDTLYTHSNRQFYRECDIYGTVDFIFGNSASIFQNCNILPVRPMSGQQNTITAQGKFDPNQNTGLSIQNCTILPGANLTGISTFLGRPWKNYSTAIFFESVLDGFIDPKGWLPWVGTFVPNTIFYAESQNFGPGAMTKNRVKWRGLKLNLTRAIVKKFTVAKFINGDQWIPATGVTYKSGL